MRRLWTKDKFFTPAKSPPAAPTPRSAVSLMKAILMTICWSMARIRRKVLRLIVLLTHMSPLIDLCGKISTWWMTYLLVLVMMSHPPRRHSTSLISGGSKIASVRAPESWTWVPVMFHQSSYKRTITKTPVICRSVTHHRLYHKQFTNKKGRQCRVK